MVTIGENGNIHCPNANLLSDKELYHRLKNYVLNEGQRESHGFLNASDSSNKNSGYIRDRTCCRCGSMFSVEENGEYLTEEMCRYHWGKVTRNRIRTDPHHFCCGGNTESDGCQIADFHVWTGREAGNYRPEEFTMTETNEIIPPDENYGVYAIDCEMSFTADGLDVTKVCVVGRKGVLYETFVLPLKPIVDFNTRFSGIIRKQIYENPEVQPISKVRARLLKLITAETILIGHGLENDLRSLKIIHENVIDTAFVFPHDRGLPYKRSLKSIVKECLGKDIQKGNHNCREDAESCLNVMLRKVDNDLKTQLDYRESNYSKAVVPHKGTRSLSPKGNSNYLQHLYTQNYSYIHTPNNERLPQQYYHINSIIPYVHPRQYALEHPHVTNRNNSYLNYNFPSNQVLYNAQHNCYPAATLVYIVVLPIMAPIANGIDIYENLKSIEK